MAIDWVQSLAAPAVGLIGGVVGWFLKDRVESRRAAEERLRQDRVKAYSEILDPILAAFIDPESNQGPGGIQRMASPEYRRNAFQLSLIGSDQVVNSFSDFLQLLYHSDNSGEFDLARGTKALGKLLLEIRKSIGNTNTTLNEKDMMRWLIKDIDDIL